MNREFHLSTTDKLQSLAASLIFHFKKSPHSSQKDVEYQNIIFLTLRCVRRAGAWARTAPWPWSARSTTTRPSAATCSTPPAWSRWLGLESTCNILCVSIIKDEPKGYSLIQVKKIDVYSRRIFPILFFIFVFYFFIRWADVSRYVSVLLTLPCLGTML